MEVWGKDWYRVLGGGLVVEAMRQSNYPYVLYVYELEEEEKKKKDVYFPKIYEL